MIALLSTSACHAQAVELLQPLLPAALLPAASPSGECTNWLAYARSSTAATDLRLQGAGPVGAWGLHQERSGPEAGVPVPPAGPPDSGETLKSAGGPVTKRNPTHASPR